MFGSALGQPQTSPAIIGVPSVGSVDHVPLSQSQQGHNIDPKRVRNCVLGQTGMANCLPHLQHWQTVLQQKRVRTVPVRVLHRICHLHCHSAALDVETVGHAHCEMAHFRV